jgi:hypothetical protein
MPPSPRAVLANLALIVASLVFALLAGELVVFRFVLLPSDVPRNAFTDGVVRYAPQQTGITRLRDEYAAPFAINAQGWNSGVGDYRLARTPGVARIAIVGDSMVEAMQVAASASLAEQLGRRLGAAAEVYRFAISGAPLSQYLWMIEREVARYAPDLVVVVLIHNDFDESFRFKPGRYTSSFLKLKIAHGRVTDEIPPTAYEPPWWDGLRFSATFRYLYYRQRVHPKALYALFLGRDVASPFQANVDVGVVARARADIRIATEYIFARLAGLARDAGFRLLLVMDGDRQAVYAGADPGPLYAGGALALNALAAEAAARNAIAFIDLHPRFAADWQARHKSFDFPHDSHWNERGHEIAAEAIAEFVRR